MSRQQLLRLSEWLERAPAEIERRHRKALARELGEIEKMRVWLGEVERRSEWLRATTPKAKRAGRPRKARVRRAVADPEYLRPGEVES